MTSSAPESGLTPYKNASGRHVRPAATVAAHLHRHLANPARRRTVQTAVAGDRFCAVMLDDGCAGVANLCPDVCGVPSHDLSHLLPPRGTPATDALAALASDRRSAIGLATANALVNRFTGGADTSSDVLDALELTPDDHVGMVGCFHPLVGRIRQRAGRLTIFERGPRLSDGLLPESHAATVLPKCSVALITATTIINGTIDRLLAAARPCREIVLLGPSTPLAPDVFDTLPVQVTLLAGVVVTDAAALLRTVSQGGGTRDFHASVIKVNVRVHAPAAEIRT